MFNLKHWLEEIMKRMWGVLGAGLIAGVVLAPLLSCNNIYGDRELLVEDPQNVVHSPHWSADGSKIYYILGENNAEPHSRGPVWSYDLVNNTQTQITEEEFWDLSVSPSGNLAITDEGYWYWIWEVETWNIVDSFRVSEEAIPHWSALTKPEFSYESENVFYYTYWVKPDSIFLRCVNLADSTDEELLTAHGERNIIAPGSGDTLFAVNDTIYNLNSNDKIPIGITPNALQWNPAVPTELLICTGEDNDLFLFDLDDEKPTESTPMHPGGMTFLKPGSLLTGTRLLT